MHEPPRRGVHSRPGGVITLTFAGARTLVLQPGDSAYLGSSTPHFLTHPGGTRTILAATITPPTW
jgi:hypothetical protein